MKIDPDDAWNTHNLRYLNSKGLEGVQLAIKSALSLKPKLERSECLVVAVKEMQRIISLVLDDRTEEPYT